MTGFANFVLFIVSFYATVNFFRIYSLSRKIFHFCLGTTGAFIAIISISGYLEMFFPTLDAQFIGEWATVFSVSFLLSAGAALVRDSKPVFSRFPRIFTFAPLALIFIYPLIVDTVAVKDWVIAIYQASALIIGMLVFSLKTHHNGNYGYLLVGIVFFAITFILFWLPESVFTLPVYVWVLLVACGILITTVGYNYVFHQDEDLFEEEDRRETWFQ